jgi:polysaccharide biosynthesis protein PslA
MGTTSGPLVSNAEHGTRHSSADRVLDSGNTIPLPKELSQPSKLVPSSGSAHLIVSAICLVSVGGLVASGFLASQACVALGFKATITHQVITTLSATFVTISALRQMGACVPHRQHIQYRLRGALVATGLGTLAAFGCLALMSAPAPAMRLWLLLWILAAGSLTTMAALISAYFADTRIYTERITRRIAVVGVNSQGASFISRINNDPARATTIIGLYDDGADSAGEVTCGVPVSGGIADLVARSRWERIDAIVLAFPLFDLDRLTRARAALSSLPFDIYMTGEILDLTCKTSRVDRLGMQPVIKIGSTPLTEWQTLQKGAVDWVFSAILLVVSLPVLLLVALAIRIDSPGPVLFRQQRRGFNNKMFYVFKFRTMYHHMADLTADRQTTRDDPRITPVGRFLRRTSLDEVPQLLNVLRGEMSLVGPRPHAPNTKAGGRLFPDAVADYALRYRVKPGITGWAQINGCRGETRTREQIEQRVAYDLFYIENWSLVLDLKIMVLTAIRELNSKVAF